MKPRKNVFSAQYDSDYHQTKCRTIHRTKSPRKQTHKRDSV